MQSAYSLSSGSENYKLCFGCVYSHFIRAKPVRNLLQLSIKFLRLLPCPKYVVSSANRTEKREVALKNHLYSKGREGILCCHSMSMAVILQ